MQKTTLLLALLVSLFSFHSESTFAQGQLYVSPEVELSGSLDIKIKGWGEKGVGDIVYLTYRNRTGGRGFAFGTMDDDGFFEIVIETSEYFCDDYLDIYIEYDSTFNRQTYSGRLYFFRNDLDKIIDAYLMEDTNDIDDYYDQDYDADYFD